MKQKNLSFLALSETQWVGKGIVKLEDTTVIFSGIDEIRDGNKRGVAIALREKPGKKKADTPWYRSD